MRQSTPGFVGARLREARDVRGLTAVSLSEIAGVSPTAISQYENDRATPSPQVMKDIAQKVNLPEHFFLLPKRQGLDSTIFYRSMSSATKGARSRAEFRVRWLQDIVGYLAEFVGFPDPDIPPLDLPSDPLLLSNLDIEEAATETRLYWNLTRGPIANMMLLLENHGFIVARDRLGAEALDGLFTTDPDGRPFILIGTDKGSAVRWRFDCAHELGHVVLHRDLATEHLAKPEQYKRIEEQAHRFAAEFLLPKVSFGEDLFAVNLDSLRALKPKWKTSIAMMIVHAQHGGLLSEDAERRLWINLSRRGWRRVEPGDESMEAEQPRLLRRAFELILQEGAQTPADVTAGLASRWPMWKR